MYENDNLESRDEAVLTLEDIARSKVFDESHWEEITRIADCWIAAGKGGKIKAAIYNPMKKVIETHAREIRRFITESADGCDSPYKEFILFHARSWKIFRILATDNPCHENEFSTNIINWNKKIDRSIKDIKKTIDSGPNFHHFEEYADSWTKVKDADRQPSATYSMTKYLRDNSLEELLGYLEAKAGTTKNNPAETAKYRRVYLYVHFHVRNWRQFKQLKRLPRI